MTHILVWQTEGAGARFSVGKMKACAPMLRSGSMRGSMAPKEEVERRAEDVLMEKATFTNVLLKKDDFLVGKTLGTGSFGRVRFVTYKANGRFYALKTLKKQAVIKLKQVDHILSEKAILEKISHPFIVNLFGCFHDSRYLYLLLEYVVGGEFFTHLRKMGRLENDTARFYAGCVVSIFEYIHGLFIIYRDLKPENILIALDGYLKLTDFGFAKVVQTRTYTLCGTPEYIAPEVLLNKGHGKAVDWWTLGRFSSEA